MAEIKSELSQIQPQNAGQHTLENTSSSEQQTLEQTVPSKKGSVQKIKPRYPSWPSSKPGPQSTLPPMGMHPVNVFRPEQVAEIAHNEQTDVTAHGSIRIDQPRSAQEALGKHKVRL